MLLELDSDTPQALCAHREVVHYQRDGVTTDSAMQLPCETPVALVYNGIAHSVMMCSAADLEDFAIGFSLSEGIIDGLQDIHDIEQVDGCQGIELHITLANRCVYRLKEKRRTLAGRTVRHLWQREPGAGGAHPAATAGQPALRGDPDR